MRERGDRGMPRACWSRLRERERERERESERAHIRVTMYRIHLYRGINQALHAGHRCHDVHRTLFARARAREGHGAEDGAGIIRGIFKLGSLIACRLIRRLDSRSRASRIARDKDEDGDEDGNNRDGSKTRSGDRLSARRPILIPRVSAVSIRLIRARETGSYQLISVDDDGRPLANRHRTKRTIAATRGTTRVIPRKDCKKKRRSDESASTGITIRRHRRHRRFRRCKLVETTTGWRGEGGGGGGGGGGPGLAWPARPMMLRPVGFVTSAFSAARTNDGRPPRSTDRRRPLPKGANNDRVKPYNGAREAEPRAGARPERGRVAGGARGLVKRVLMPCKTIPRRDDDVLAP